MDREPRFPDIDWYCDCCGAYLNSQKNFDDHKYIWRCTECGYKNSLSWDNISYGDSKVLKFLLYLLGFLSFIGLWTSIMLAVSMWVFGADKQIYLGPFYIFLLMYLLAFVLSIIVEFGLRHSKRFSIKNLLGVFFRNLKEDVLAPFLCVKQILGYILGIIGRMFPSKRKNYWRRNKVIDVLFLIYTLILCAEIVAFFLINGAVLG